MRAREVRDLPDEELFEQLEANKEELFNLRFQFATGQLDNPMRLRQVRHDIARILTILRERKTEEDLEAAVARADEEALERSRDAQARGEKTGQSMSEAAEATRTKAAAEEEALEAEAGAEEEQGS